MPDSTDLIKEALITANLKEHKNILQLHGICFDLEEPKYIILEYADMGDLLAYLRKIRTSNVLNYNLISFLFISLL